MRQLALLVSSAALLACGASEVTLDATRVDGPYAVRPAGGGPILGTLRLVAADTDGTRGTYAYEGAPIDPAREHHFVRHPAGHYRFVADDTPTPTPGHAILGVVRFDPDADGFDPDDPRRSLLLRWDAEREVVYAHSLVSEFETLRIERERSGAGAEAEPGR